MKSLVLFFVFALSSSYSFGDAMTMLDLNNGRDSGISSEMDFAFKKYRDLLYSGEDRQAGLWLSKNSEDRHKNSEKNSEDRHC